MAASTSNQNASNTDGTDFNPVRKKRGKRVRNVSIVICLVAATLILIFCFVDQKKDECVTSVPTSATSPNKIVSSNLFIIALTLCSIVLGTFSDRLSLVFEESRHLHSRYDSKTEMVKACFSGIVWSLVFILLASATIIFIFVGITATHDWFELKYYVHLLSGICITPLIMRLVNKDTKSDVYISRTLEEKGMYVANGLAWSYYFDYLKYALLKFSQVVNEPFPDPYKHVELSRKDLLLLVSFYDDINDDLKHVDSKIKKVFDLGNEEDPFRFPVYRLTVNEHEKKYFAIQCVKQPLKYLREIKKLREEPKRALPKRPLFKDEVTLLYQTLCEIVKNPPYGNFTGTCVLIPVLTSNGLENGGLVKCIMNVVEPSRTKAQNILTVETLPETWLKYPIPVEDSAGTTARLVSMEKTLGMEQFVDLNVVSEKYHERHNKNRESVRQHGEELDEVKLHVVLAWDVHRREVKPSVHKVGKHRCCSIGSSQILNIADGSEQDGYSSNDDFNLVKPVEV